MEDFLIPDRARIAASLRVLARIDRGQRAVVAVNGRVPEPEPARRAWSDVLSTAATDIPQASSVVEIDLTHVARRLDEVRTAYERRGVLPSFTPHFAEALLGAVREAPQANAGFDAEARAIRRYPAVHLGLSLASTDGSSARYGVIRDADTRNAIGLALEIEAIRASGSLDPRVLGEATLTLADYGPGSALYGVPLVLPGQVVAVRVGSVDERLLVRERRFGLAPTAWVCVSIDHRALDGMDAGVLLAAMKRTLEQA